MPPASIDSVCPCEEDIAALLGGRLDDRRVRAIEAHVSECPACRRLLSALVRTPVTASHATADSISPTLPADPGSGEKLPTGARIGRYAVLDWLGAGGMGVVYAAYDPELNRKVAVKVLRNDSVALADRLPSPDLLREAQAMARLAHPNVVTVFDVGSVDGGVFIAMELIEGVTLTHWLRVALRTQGEIIATFVAAGKGVAAAHEAGLIHRDFKPDNVLIGNDGRVRVTDFGLARAAPGVPLDWMQVATAEPGRGGASTRTGLVGTLAYMAPEQFLGRGADARSDQFSFAVALHEALFGERPLAHPQLATGAAATSHVILVPPRGGAVPLALRRVLQRALSPAPDERYPSMAALLAALAPDARPQRSRAIAIGALVVTAAAVALAGAYAIHLGHTAERVTELVGWLRGVAPEMRARLRSAHMLPLHDIQSAREGVRAAMRDVEQHLKTRAGQDQVALGDFVLGEGYRALGANERALELLEAAWEAGVRGPDIDVALGSVLGAIYENRLEHIEQTVQTGEREAQMRAVEERYRDPAMVHLRAVLASGTGTADYLEALIAFHQHRFAEAVQHAQAAFRESPTFYEAGVLEAKAHNEAGHVLLAANKVDEGEAELAAARRVFERVLEIARSDDEAWLSYAKMLDEQAVSLLHGSSLSADLQRAVIAAVGNVQRINPENWKAFLREAQIHLAQGNIEVIEDRDPELYVGKSLGLAEQARAHGGDAAEIDEYVCTAYWERAVFQGERGIDPHPAFEQALSACRNAAAGRPTGDNYAMLGTAYETLASYDGDHGKDPMQSFELGERNLRTGLDINDNALLHYNFGRLWTKRARYEAKHGRSPQRAVDSALAEYRAALRSNARHADAWCGISDALAARARFQLGDAAAAESTLAQAHAAIERALALTPKLDMAVRAGIALSELDAEVLLERNADPSSAAARMRADAKQLLSSRPDDGFAHRAWSRAELVAARWAIGHHQAVDQLLARAAVEAARAREVDALDALAWTWSAEVEELRAGAAGTRRVASAAAAAGLAFIQRAVKIDPGLLAMLKVRDDLVRRTQR